MSAMIYFSNKPDSYLRIEKVFKMPLMCINARLSRINQQSYKSNKGRSGLILLTAMISGLIYGIITLTLFHKTWYHKVLSVFSTMIFIFVSTDMYFELLEKRIKKDIPSTLKMLSHYYTHYQGNVVPALNDTIDRCSKNNKVFLSLLRDALTAPDCEKQVAQLEEAMPSVWLKMLCRIMLFAKENGGRAASPEQREVKVDVIARNLKRLNSVLMQLNIEQEFNDVELMGMQLFVFSFPYFIIPISQWYNSSLLSDMNIGLIYDSVQAQNLVAIMMIVGNLGTVFIHWMRKLHN